MEYESQLTALYHREGNYPRDNYENGGFFLSKRPVMSNWIFQMCHRFSTDRFLPHSALLLLDSCVSSGMFDEFVSTANKIFWYNVCAMFCLQIAFKNRQGQGFDTNYISRLLRRSLSENDVTSFEVKILQDLKWFSNPPTSEDFLVHLIDNLRRYLKPKISCHDVEETCAKVQLDSYNTSEAMVFDNRFVEFKISQVTYFSMWYSMQFHSIFESYKFMSVDDDWFQNIYALFSLSIES